MILGIDLGTTYSVGAYINDGGEPKVITNSEGNTTTPSVVLFDTDKNIVVGDAAKEKTVVQPDDVISTVKNQMGNKMVLKEWNDQKYTPEMISSFIIRKVIQDASKLFGKKITGVVVTVPAYFNDAKRKATEDAITLAGIPLVGIINEPTAAALCYVNKNKLQKGNFLIYDLGGGTFDVTVLKVEENNKINVLATGGLSNTGGRFFDQYIVDYVVEIIQEKYGIDLEDEEYKYDLAELYLKAEKIKKQLSSSVSASIVMKIGRVVEQITVTREQFEKMIAPIYLRTENKVRDTVKRAGLAIDKIDKILMVGGSSRIPYVNESIKRLMGKEVSNEIHPDEAVALGAALFGKMNVSDESDIKFYDVCSHSIGVVVEDQNGKEENEIMITRNSKLPAENVQRFRTIDTGQKMICLKVTEGEFKELSDVSIIGEIEIVLPSGLATNELVLIKICLDKFQLIHVYVELPSVNFSGEYKIKRNSNLDVNSISNLTGILRDYVVN